MRFALLSVTILATLAMADLAPGQTAKSVDNPAGANSSGPNLVRGADGRVYFTWIETQGKAASLRFARWLGDAWSEPRTIASGDDWFVNWADFPSMAALADGTLVAQWLEKSAADTYAYDVKLTLSRDGGTTWSQAQSPHDDGTPTEHGFVSLIAVKADTFGVFWLDGRAMATADKEKPGSMALRFRTLNRDGTFGEEVVVDDRVCECCQTKAIALDKGESMVVYRDRSKGEVRDIGIAKVTKDGATGTVRYADNWRISGCPVNGPAIHRFGDSIAITWFTGADDEAKVLARMSTDGGVTFGPERRIDDGDPLGRVDIAYWNGGTAIATWLEREGDHAEIRYRWLSSCNATLASGRISETIGARASGFPRIAFANKRLLVAWTDTADKRVRTASLALPRFSASDYFPLSGKPKDGGSWVYRITRNGVDADVDFKGWIGERRALPERGLQDAFNQYVSGDKAKTVYFQVLGEVLLEAFSFEHRGSIPWTHYKPPITLLPASFNIGDRWSWSGTLKTDHSRGESESSVAKFTVLDVAERDTPSGRLSTIHVRESHDSGLIVDRWFAKGVGLVEEHHHGAGKPLKLKLLSRTPASK